MANETEEIKARLDIVDLISEYIRLKQTGNNWRALCPFHNEKSPSFMVSRDKQFFHCFGCSEGGDIFTFVQKMEGLEFPEALRLLAQKAGVTIQSKDPKLVSEKNKLLDITRLAAEFWHRTLLDSTQAQKARDYLKKRKVSDIIIASYKLGYALESWDTLLAFLKKRGFSDQEIFLAGLTVKKDRGVGFYDRFRDRLMFPINDAHGNPIGFSGRTLNPEEKGGKYINTPQTSIYNKSLALFNIDKAKQEIKKQDLAIIVEGQMDVLASMQVGVENVIASSGTALTLEQVKIIKRFTNNLAIAFDTDPAGQSAAQRGIDVALTEELNVKVIVVPGGKDPDECIKENPDNWKRAIAEARSIMEYYFETVSRKHNLRSPEGKKAAAKVLLPVIAKIGNQIEQAHWLQKLADELGVTEALLRSILEKRVVHPTVPAVEVSVSSPKPPVTIPRQRQLAESVLALALTKSLFLESIIAEFKPEMVTDADLQELYKKLIVYYTEIINADSDKFDFKQFSTTLGEISLVEVADRLVLLGEKDFFDFEPTALHNELRNILAFTKRDYYTHQLKDIEHQIKFAEQQGAHDEAQLLTQRFTEVVGQLRALD